jgi:hypothetical protein
MNNRSIRKGEQGKEAAKEKSDISEYFVLSVLRFWVDTISLCTWEDEGRRKEGKKNWIVIGRS